MEVRELNNEQLHLMWLALVVAKACRGAGIEEWTASLAADLPASELYWEVFAAPLMREHSDALSEAIASEVISEWLAEGDAG